MMSAFIALTALAAATTVQDLEGFVDGNVLPEYGQVAPMRVSFTPPAGLPFRVVFDVARVANEEAESPHIGKVARFLNMHGEGGLDPRPLDMVVVIHGPAVGDMVDEDGNVQRGLVEALLEHNVRFIVCGQSMRALGVDDEELIDGVEVALSAMTAHASLMADGYNSMPF